MNEYRNQSSHDKIVSVSGANLVQAVLSDLKV